MHTTNLKTPLLIIFGLVFFITGAASAGQPTDEQSMADQLVGQWREVDGRETIVFTQDRQVTITFDQKKCFSLSGQYTVVNNQEVSVALEGALSAFIKQLVLKITLDDGFLYLTAIDVENTNKDIETKIHREKPFTKYEKISAQP